MAKNVISSKILARLTQILTPKIFRGFYLQQMLEIVASCNCMQFQEKTSNPNSRKWQKNSFSARFRHTGLKFGTPKLFSKIWLCQSQDIMVRYHHVKYQEKLMIQSSENLDIRRGGRTDRTTRVISQDAVRLTLKVQSFVREISRFFCFCEIHRFQNLCRHHRHYYLMEVTFMPISFESYIL